MNKILSYIRRIVAIIDICCLVIFTMFSQIKDVDYSTRFFFNLLICFLFSIILLKGSCCNEEQIGKTSIKKKNWVYFLIFAGVFLSVVEIYMFYEEMIIDRGGISSAIAAIASYTLFDSAHKYITSRKE